MHLYCRVLVHHSHTSVMYPLSFVTWRVAGMSLRSSDDHLARETMQMLLGRLSGDRSSATFLGVLGARE